MMIDIFLILSSLSIAVSGFSSQAVPLHPIIMVHGYYGTRLLYTVDRSVPGSPPVCPQKNIANETLWLNFFNYLDPLSNACWLAAASLHYDNFTRRSYPAAGVTVTTTPFGELDGSEWLVAPPLRIYDDSYFVYMVDSLVALGYERGRNIRGAPYDWRLAPNENEVWLLNFRILIERMYYENGNKSVILINHSMAGQFTYVFLNSMPYWWRNQFIRSWILIATCFSGVFKYQYAYFGIEDYPANLFPATRPAIRTYSTTAFLLPRKPAFGDEVLIRGTDGDYRAEDYERFFQIMGYPDAYEQWKDVRGLYDEYNLIPPGNFSIYCIAGFGKQTLKGAVFDGPVSPTTPHVPVYGDGDSFVNANALRYCYQFGKRTPKFGIKEFRNKDHLQMIRDPEPIEHVVGLVNSINYNAERFTNEFV